MISETEYDDVELSEVEVVSEELELPDELSLLAHEIKNRIKQQNNKIQLKKNFIIVIIFFRLPEPHYRYAVKRKNKVSVKKYKEYQQVGKHD